MKKLLISVIAMFAVSTANAALIEFENQASAVAGDTLVWSDRATPTNITGDAIFTLSIFGDFNSSHENAVLDLDGFSLGTVLDNNPANDPFDFASDVGNQSGSASVGTAVISGSMFASLISDGLLTFSFDTTPTVNCCGAIRGVSGSISFTESVSVTEPGTIALFFLGLAGLIVSRRRKSA